MLDALIDLIYAVWFGLLDFGAYLLDNLDLVAFMILAAIAVLAAIYVVTDKEVVHSAFFPRAWIFLTACLMMSQDWNISSIRIMYLE